MQRQIRLTAKEWAEVVSRFALQKAGLIDDSIDQSFTVSVTVEGRHGGKAGDAIVTYEPLGPVDARNTTTEPAA